MYKVDSGPSNAKEVIDVDAQYETLLNKMTDGPNIDSVKATIARYSHVSKHSIGKGVVKLVANGFPGGDIADLSQYVEKLFKYDDSFPRKRSFESDGYNPDDL